LESQSYIYAQNICSLWPATDSERDCSEYSQFFANNGGSVASNIIQLLSFLAILLFSCTQESFADSKSITWAHADFEVATILRGPEKGHGTCDRMEQLISSELPEYSYNSMIANYRRIIEEIRFQNQVLCACLLKTKEREDFVEFSIIAQLSLPNGIILLKTNRDKFKPFINADGKVDFGKLVKASQLTLGYSNGRAYSGIIDQIINENKEMTNLYGRSGIDQFEGLVNMMIQGKIDYTIGFPQEKLHFGPMAKSRKELIYLPVEGMPDYVPVYIGAPKNEWGKEVIGRINKILLKKRHTPEVLSYYDYWIDDNSIVLHHQVANKLFGEQIGLK
jgi:uncharacterized protein (TIGR02285 family)